MENLTVLKENIIEIVDKEIANKKLLQAIKDEFLKRGLNTRVPDLLWRNKLDWEKLSNHEYMAIASSVRYEMSKQHKDNGEKENFLDLDNEKFALDKYFTKGEIKEYHTLNKVKENLLDFVELKNVVKIDEKNYHCIISAEELSKYRKSQLIVYNPKFQRASKIVTTKNGVTRRAINLNKKGVTELTNRFLEKDIAPTSITLCVLYDDENALSGNFSFIPTFTDNIGNLIIKPDVRDELSPEESIELNIPDGFHRYNAITRAFEIAEREGKYLDYKLGCFIHVMKEEEEIRYVRDVFKRSDTSAEYLKALDETEENKFVSLFENNSNWLRDHVATTNKELKLKNKYVTKKLLVDSFKKTDVIMDTSTPTSGIAREKIAKKLDELLDYIKQELFENDLEKMQSSLYLNDKIFEIYIRFIARIRNEKSYYSLFENLVNYLNDSQEDIEKNLKGRQGIEKIIAEVLENGI